MSATKAGFPSVAAVSLLLCALPATAQALSTAQIAKRVDDHYNHLRSLQAHYTERYQGMGMDRTESGTLLLRRPGRMRWNYDTPAGKVFVLDGKDAISYTPGDPQASRVSAKQLEDLRSPLRFLLGHTQLARELDHLSAAPVEDGYSLAGTPPGQPAGSARIRLVSLVVDSRGVIHSLRIDETDGAMTTFTFTDQHENVPAPDTDFVFTPPPGVPVVNGTAPIG